MVWLAAYVAIYRALYSSKCGVLSMLPCTPNSGSHTLTVLCWAICPLSNKVGQSSQVWATTCQQRLALDLGSQTLSTVTEPRGSQEILLEPVWCSIRAGDNGLFSFGTGTVSSYLSHQMERANLWQERVRATHRKRQRQTRREKKRERMKGRQQEIISKLLGFLNLVILKNLPVSASLSSVLFTYKWRSLD